MKRKEEISNYEKFPSNVFEPKKIRINGSTYLIYLARFNGMYDIYNYLKGEPKINRKVFKKLSSVENSFDFAGKPYDKAVEDLIDSCDPGYEEFLRLQRNLSKAQQIKVNKYKVVRTVAGGHLNIPAYSTGNPLCYETIERIEQPRFIRVHINLSYSWNTSKSQIFNRAIIITNILKSLENAGYSVDVNTFEISKDSDEIFHAVVQVKKHGEKLNMIALYKTLCNVEFLRRILFRLLETMDVKNSWSGYGEVLSENFVRKVLNLNKDDIYIGTARELGIYGHDLANDFECAINYLNMDDKINVERAKNRFREEAKVLQKLKQ